MKKLNVAIIGQGRSGKNIHGAFFRSEKNEYFNVKYVAEVDAFRRQVAEKIYPGCVTFADYRDLFDIKDIDLVVNATFSETHYSITKELLLNGFNVLCEKPFGRTRYECEELIKIAKEKGVLLQCFHQSLHAPFFTFTKEVLASGKIGELLEVSIRYNGFSRRWDWQTLQKKCAGGLYNTGPHPIGYALSFLDFDPEARVVYSKLATALTSGDADDFAKVIITAPNKPLIDVEVISCDAYNDHNIKLIGTKGTYACTFSGYKLTYIVDGENPERPVIEEFLKNENGDPIYCSEELKKHTEEGKFEGSAFDVGTLNIYKDIYYALTEGKVMRVVPEMAAQVIGVIETVHAQNPLPLKY